MFKPQFSLLALTIIILLSHNGKAKSQIIPDDSLGAMRSIINQDLIVGGAKRGANLFHSFKTFNLNVGNSVYFNNPQGIQNIISRITGTSSSVIDGRLGVNGNASLFFINPNGIIFGKNSSLDISGSFLASTASAIETADGYRFNANKDLSIPEYLGFGDPSSISLDSGSSIEVLGNGHKLLFDRTEIIQGAGLSIEGLRSSEGKSITLIGGDVLLNGGIVTAPSGNINVGAVKEGTVALNIDKGWIVDYQKANTLGIILLENSSLIDTSGFTSSNIVIAGQNVTLKDSSFIISQYLSGFQSGKIYISAKENLNIFGNTSSNVPTNAAQIRTGIWARNFGGLGTDIEINASDISLANAGNIVSLAVLDGSAGNININSNSLTVAGFSPFLPTEVSVITSSTAGSENAGKININTGNLIVEETGAINTSTLGTGNGGDINIFASKSIKLNGFNPLVGIPSLISSISYNKGDAGNLSIFTPNLTLQGGSNIASLALAEGNSGRLNLNVGDLRIENSFITSGAVFSGQTLIDLFNLPPFPSGDSGEVSIVANSIRLNGGSITAQNQGAGNAGSLEVNSRSLILEDNASLLASTIGGEGGNIKINSNLILLRNNSSLSSSALNNGTGGSISINSDLIAGNSDSRISANAEFARGGMVNISTNGILFNTDNITATSQNGPMLDGTIVINTGSTSFDTESELQNALRLSESNFSCDSLKSSQYTTIDYSFLENSDDQLETISAKQNIPTFLDSTGKRHIRIRVQGWIETNESKIKTQSVVENPKFQTELFSSACNSIQIYGKI